jgi:hypothetical protein
VEDGNRSNDFSAPRALSSRPCTPFGLNGLTTPEPTIHVDQSPIPSPSVKLRASLTPSFVGQSDSEASRDSTESNGEEDYHSRSSISTECSDMSCASSISR